VVVSGWRIFSNQSHTVNSGLLLLLLSTRNNNSQSSPLPGQKLIELHLADLPILAFLPNSDGFKYVSRMTPSKKAIYSFCQCWLFE
jgi:hypothetical protein